MPQRRISLPSGERIETAANSFEVLHRLGNGGTSVTFLAIADHGELAGIPVAIKIFDDLSDAVRQSHFSGEIALLTELNHPSVLKVMDTGAVLQTFRDQPILYPLHVTPFYADTLERKIAERLPMQTRLLYAAQLLSAARYLSLLPDPIVHRDIKPSNIYVDGSRCVLGDFGMFTTESVIRNNAHDPAFRDATGQMMAADYRVPEIADFPESQIPFTAAANVYQLGLVLYRLFVGSRAPRVAELTDQHTRPIPGTLGHAIGALIQAMLLRDASTRASASEALESCTEIANKLLMQNFFLNGRTI